MPDAPGYKAIIDHLFDGVYFVDRDRVITYWNLGAERITGYTASEVVGRSCRDGILNHVTPDGVPLCTGDCPLKGTMADGEPREADVFLHHAEGHRVPVLVRCAPLRDEQGTITGAVESFSADRGARTTRVELRELRQSARTDALTGVHNRAFLEGRLRAMAAEADHHGQSDAAVVMLDIDRFKQVNDTWGHEAGDRVLRMVATSVRGNLRSSDLVGRWGGEEFLVLLYGIEDDDTLRTVVDKTRKLVAWSRLDLDEQRVSVTLSMGATRWRSDDTPESAVARADALMYQSKHGGRDRVTVG